MKKLKFLRDSVIDFRAYEKDESPDLLFSDEQATLAVTEGNAVVVADAVAATESETPNEPKSDKPPRRGAQS